MSTLSSVIELKDKNRAAAEASRGFEVAEEERYATKFKPITDAISSASGEIIRYSGDKDVKLAAKEVIDASTQHRVALAQANTDPTNQGLAALVVAYAAQKLFAEAKMNYLIAAEDLAKASPAQRVAALGALEKTRDDYAEALSAFQRVDIPVGFKQTVSIQQPPPKGSVFPGANLEISPTPALPAQAAPQLVAKQPPPGPRAPPPAPGLEAQPKVAPEPTAPPSLKSKKKPAAPQPPLEQSAPPGSVPPSVHAKNIMGFINEENALDKQIRTTPVNGAAWFDTKDQKIYFSRVNGSETISGTLKHKGVNPDTYDVVFAIEGRKDETIAFNVLMDIFIRKGIILLVLDPTTLRRVLQIYIRLFGGWGRDFEGAEFFDPAMPNHSPIAVDIAQNPEYANVIAEIVNKPGQKKTIGEGMKFTTKATPKASVMRLSPEGYYGNLVIDVQALYNDGRLIARERGDQYGSNLSGGCCGNGKIVLDAPMAPGLKNLVIKRAMQTTIDKAAPETQKQLRKLRKLAGFIPSKPKATKGKGNSGGSNVIVVGNVKDILERLKVACGVYDAGNRSKKNAQLISELASKLMEHGAIDEKEYAHILEKYKA